MYVIVVGGGRVGENLIDLLIKDGHSVVLIEKDPARAKYIAETYDVLVINGDGAEAKFLEDANIRRADVLVAASGDDHTNLVACQLAKNTYGVKRVVARVSNPVNKVLYEKLGIDFVVSTTESSAYALFGGIKGYIGLMVFGGVAQIVELVIPENSPVADHPIGEINLPWESFIMCVYKKGELYPPREDLILEAGDHVLLLLKFGVDYKIQKIFFGRIIE